MVFPLVPEGFGPRPLCHSPIWCMHIAERTIIRVTITALLGMVEIAADDSNVSGSCHPSANMRLRQPAPDQGMSAAVRTKGISYAMGAPTSFPADVAVGRRDVGGDIERARTMVSGLVGSPARGRGSANCRRAIPSLPLPAPARRRCRSGPADVLGRDDHHASSRRRSVGRHSLAKFDRPPCHCPGYCSTCFQPLEWVKASAWPGKPPSRLPCPVAAFWRRLVRSADRDWPSPRHHLAAFGPSKSGACQSSVVFRCLHDWHVPSSLELARRVTSRVRTFRRWRPVRVRKASNRRARFAHIGPCASLAPSAVRRRHGL